MDTNCVPYAAAVLLFCYKKDFMLALSDKISFRCFSSPPLQPLHWHKSAFGQWNVATYIHNILGHTSHILALFVRMRRKKAFNFWI